MLKLKSRIALIILLTLIFTNTHVFASEIKEAEAASFASGPSLNTLVDNMSESDGVSYIYYNLGGAANNINNYTNTVINLMAGIWMSIFQKRRMF